LVYRPDKVITGAILFIVANENNERIGEVFLTCDYNKNRDWEIGYKFHYEYWGRGYASEAVTRLINYGFYELNVRRISAYINYENKRSVALAKRVGMFQEGHLREVRWVNGEWNDEIIFSLLKKDFDTKV